MFFCVAGSEWWEHDINTVKHCKFDREIQETRASYHHILKRRFCSYGPASAYQLVQSQRTRCQCKKKQTVVARTSFRPLCIHTPATTTLPTVKEFAINPISATPTAMTTAISLTRTMPGSNSNIWETIFETTGQRVSARDERAMAVRGCTCCGVTYGCDSGSCARQEEVEGRGRGCAMS